VLAVVLAVAAAATAETYVERIGSDLSEGRISVEEALLYYCWSVVDESRLPSSISDGATAEPCGTPAMDAAASLLETLPEGSRDPLAGYLARPVVGSPEYTTDSPMGWFKIHWTDNGPNATDQNWVNTIAAGMDSSWAHQVNTMDWDAPPSDLGLGGDSKYDVYVMSLTGGTIGYCSHGGEPADPTTPEADYASHIAMSNLQSWGVPQILETCSHEFQHAVQNGYEAAEPSWFKENCATWMQNECWPTNLYVDYLHTGENCLRKPWYDIRYGSMYYYGATPWPMYMQVRCAGQQTVRMVWENCADTVGANMLDAIEETAENYGMTFIEWLAEYTCWRWFTGNLADDEHYDYSESSLWTPGAYVFPYHTVNSLPWTGDEGSYPPDTYGNHWIKINVTGYQGWITVDFNGRDQMDWVLGVIQTASSGSDAFEWHHVTNDPATLQIGVNTTGWQYVVLFVQPTTDTSVSLYYDISVSTQTGVEEEESSGITLEPSSNPFVPGGSVQIGLPEAGYTTLGVYDIYGRLVETLVSGQMDQGIHAVVWGAEGLSSGTYFLRLNASGGGLTERVVLQK
jgi:hypothetical protein